MENSTTVKRLEKIRDAYRGIYERSQKIGADDSADTIESAMKDRAALLEKIARNNRGVETAPHLWKNHMRRMDRVEKLVSEIRTLIQNIVDKDKDLNKIIRTRIEGIRTELLSLSSSSKAAVAYTGHQAAANRAP